MVWAIPGNPFAGQCGDRTCPDAYIQAMTEQYNLNDNIVVQYFKYMANVFQGDFGETYSGLSVGQLIADAYPVTIRLTLVALIVEAVVGILAGILTGLRGRSFLDNLVLISTLFLIALPVFVTGFILQVLLGTEWGIISPTVSSEAAWSELLVPGIVLGSLSMAYVARLTRTSIVENKNADFIRTAYAKGLPDKRIIGIHLLRNSIIPVLTFIGTDVGALMGGAVVTEGVFRINGIGGLIIQGIQNQESITVTSIVTLLVLVYLFMNLIVDLLYGVLDPRIRYD